MKLSCNLVVDNAARGANLGSARFFCEVLWNRTS
jgi:hypothetical protein